MLLSKSHAVSSRAVSRQSSLTDRLCVALAATVLSVAGLLAVPTSAGAVTTTTGTWYSYPAQVAHTSTSTTTGTAYKSAVRAPINADGSSNWPAKRGVIPVQFDLLAAPTTTTTTTTTYDPPVWQSLNLSPGVGVPGSVSFAGLNLSPTLTFKDITNLSATYNFTTGDCFGGSLRWTVYDPSVRDGLINVYYGTPNGPDQGCSGANSGSGQNLITTGITANRFEIGNSGTYVTYADVLAATNNGADTVTGAQLTLDSGWKADQKANVSNVTVNDNTWVPKTTGSTTLTTVTGAYTNTCTLPVAKLFWAKNDATPDGAINEAESIQPKDTGVYYRNVDCKYIYNLDVSSLNGQGTYTVWVNIDGMNIATPATFDLR